MTYLSISLAFECTKFEDNITLKPSSQKQLGGGRYTEVGNSLVLNDRWYLAWYYGIVSSFSVRSSNRHSFWPFSIKQDILFMLSESRGPLLVSRLVPGAFTLEVSRPEYILRSPWPDLSKWLNRASPKWQMILEGILLHGRKLSLWGKSSFQCSIQLNSTRVCLFHWCDLAVGLQQTANRTRIELWTSIEQRVRLCSKCMDSERGPWIKA